ncbi:MAG: M20 family metallopeptidase [Candidatus Zhuqueibacterota bacterium]
MDILKDPLAVLQRYLQIDTTNSQNDRDVCRFWELIFSRYDVNCRHVRSGDFCNFETYLDEGRRERILLQNHMDVVPALRGEWNFDPFGGRIDAGYLYGRGALDMKSIAVFQAYAFLRLVYENHPRKHLLKFCSMVQEETSSEHGARFYADYLKRQGYSDLVVLGEGGFLLRIPEIYAGNLFLYETEQKGLLWLAITVHSRGGHGSLGGKTKKANPVLRAAKVADRLSRIKFPVKIETSVEVFISSLLDVSHNFLIRHIVASTLFKRFLFRTKMGSGMLCRLITRATAIPDLFQTSLNVTNISTDKIEGIAERTQRLPLWRRLLRRGPTRKLNPITRTGVNVIPSYATVTCDIRFNSVYTADELIEIIRKVIPKDAELTVMNSQKFSTSPHHLIVDPIRRALDSAGQVETIVSPFLFIAASDNYFFRNQGFASFGLVPNLISLDELDRIHGCNERIHIQHFREGCQLYYRILKQLIESLPDE